MSALTYNLDLNEAKAGSGLSARIEDTGPYVGEITQAKAILAKTGSQGIELSFTDSTGANASFLSLYTQSADGAQLRGAKTLQALMACLKLRTLTPKNGKAEEWQGNGMVEVDAEIYPDLCKKPIGLLLRREEYLSRDNEVKSSMSLFAPFTADTRQTAIEVLERGEAKALDKMVASLKDKTVSPAIVQQNQYMDKKAVDYGRMNEPDYTHSQAPSIQDFDDDIPF